ncbi:MAG: hypothetical protein AAF432_09815 [Planctomycetota bacterium]
MAVTLAVFCFFIVYPLWALYASVAALFAWLIWIIVRWTSKRRANAETDGGVHNE